MFNAGRRENVVIAVCSIAISLDVRFTDSFQDTLIFPNHQVRPPLPASTGFLGCLQSHISVLTMTSSTPIHSPKRSDYADLSFRLLQQSCIESHHDQTDEI